MYLRFTLCTYVCLICITWKILNTTIQKCGTCKAARHFWEFWPLFDSMVNGHIVFVFFLLSPKSRTASCGECPKSAPKRLLVRAHFQGMPQSALRGWFERYGRKKRNARWCEGASAAPRLGHLSLAGQRAFQCGTWDSDKWHLTK